jgi:hypothetical protein
VVIIEWPAMHVAGHSHAREADMNTLVNISRSEAAKRRNLGVVMALIALTIAAAQVFSGDLSRWWRCAVFVPAWAAALGFLQAHYST